MLLPAHLNMDIKHIQPDAVLGVIVGTKPLPRSQMTKKLWDYIKKHNLQDAKKRTQINADDALKAVFGGKKQVSMFEMTKLVSKHVKFSPIPGRFVMEAAGDFLHAVRRPVL